MDNTLLLELHTFTTAIYGGLVSGLIYDIYRMIRYIFKTKKIITFIGDLLLWIAILSTWFYFLIKINNGQIRGYIVVGFILGIYLYIKFFSSVIYPFIIKLGVGIKETLQKIFLTLMYPFRSLKKKSSPIFKKIKTIPIEIIRQTKKYRKIMSSKK